MDGAVHNNSSLLPIHYMIFSSLVECPIVLIEPFVDLILWVGHTSGPIASAPNVPYPTIYI